MAASESLASLKKNHTMGEVQRNKIMSVNLLNFSSAILQLSQFSPTYSLVGNFTAIFFDEICCLLAALFTARYLLNYYSYIYIYIL